MKILNDLIRTLEDCITSEGAVCFSDIRNNPESMQRRLYAINDIVRDAIVQIGKVLENNNLSIVDEPEESQGSGFYRTVIGVEVLSDQPVLDMGLADIAEQIDSGDFSGRMVTLSEREVSKKDMADLLTSQHSDPSFLLGDDAWVYSLHKGDTVHWNDPDNGLCSKDIVIETIEYYSGEDITEDTVLINGELMCFVSELS